MTPHPHPPAPARDARPTPATASLSGVLLLCLHLAAIPASGAEDPTLVHESLSAHPERLLLHQQGWGDLGLDTAAHAPHLAGAPLRIGSTTYLHGLGHHAPGRLVVLLAGEFERFEADVGLQPCPGGSVIFRVTADGQPLFDSGVLHDTDEPRPVSVPVAGVQELVLEALDANDGIACDMANWANARLLRSPAGPSGRASAAVDIAPFAEVFTADPDRTDGARARRLEEFPAEDVFLETGLQPHAGGRYVLVPNANRIACVGLKWFSRRPLREVRLPFPADSPMPSPDTVQVQAWFGESAWQGHWQTLDLTPVAQDRELVASLPARAPMGGLLQTRKIRWRLPASGPSIAILPPVAYSRARWTDDDVIARALSPTPGATGQVRVFNGACLSADGAAPTSPSTWLDWDLSRPLKLRVRHSLPSALKADATVLQFRLPAGGVGVAIDDLLTHRHVNVPSRGLDVALAEPPDPVAPPAPADPPRPVTHPTSILDEVRARPDQTLAQALARTHRAAQDEGPVMLSLSCDNTKYVVGRNGDLSFPVTPTPDTEWFAGAGNVQFILGDGQRDHTRRQLDDPWLPLPRITFEREGLRCTERVFVAPADADDPDPARLNRRPLCLAECLLENLGDQPAPARLEVPFRLAGNPPSPAELHRENDHRFRADLGLSRAVVLIDASSTLSARAAGGSLLLTGTLPPRGRTRLVVVLSGPDAPSPAAVDVPALRAATERHWRAVLAPATQIETPDPRLNDILRASQVRCLIAARHEAGGARVAPWIAAMAYGPLESEAHSVIRGMDALGHHSFARRGLEYFIHRYQPAGFLTTGYTTFGTAWHLWTLGEHVQLTSDLDWLRSQAPALRQAGDWILRQLAKTRRPGPDGQPLPESGLMPPAVMADWNAFACHFMLNGYYHAALRHLATALQRLDDPRSTHYARAAEQLRQDILRAYRWTQAQAPALPLRNGSWIPHYPSQVHSPGKLEDFFPGDDAGRSWAYDIELGAHQLVPTGVLAPDDPEVTRMLHHLEDVAFLGEGWFDYPAAENARDWFHLGGFAKVQPYYARNAEIYALRDEVKPFLRSYFNSLASLLNTEVLTLWEHFRHSGAWDKTHETGYFLHQTRLMLVQERDNDLWLAPLLPADWLRDGAELDVRAAPTLFGPVSYHLASRDGARTIHAHILPPARTPPGRIVLRLRHPQGLSIHHLSASVQPPPTFDASRQTITLIPSREPIAFTVHFQ